MHLKNNLFLIPVLLLSLTVLFCCSNASSDFDIQAHRGGRDRHPENTLSAFKYSALLGVSTLELDLAVTKDHAVVVSHDPGLTSKLVKDKNNKFLKDDEPIFIKDISLKELKQYSVGEINPDSKYYHIHKEQIPVPGEKIPTLNEVFEMVSGLENNKIKFNLEIKTYPPFPEYTINYTEFVILVLNVVKKYKMEKRVTIQSFDWRSLKEVKHIAADIPVACLTVKNFHIDGESYNLQPGKQGSSPWLAGYDYDDYKNIISLAADFGAEIISPYYKEISKQDIDEAHKKGLKIIPWTINNKNTMKQFIAWGVDGIITDRPDILKEVLNKN